MSITSKPGCNDVFEHGAITVDDAVKNILNVTSPVKGFCKLPLRDCKNRVLFEDIKSPIDVPAFNNSAMDGYAVASSDLPSEGTLPFKVSGTAFAGKPFTGKCESNECVRIMTGGIVPESTDCIVIQEDVNVLNTETIEIGAGHKKNQNIRFAGEDIKSGEQVLTRGEFVKAADLGVLASLGINECRVFRKPRVCFFSTGDELKSLGQVLKKGEIYDSNRYSLYGLLKDCHVEIIDMGVIEDDREAIKQAFLTAAEGSDVIITSGGVSVGEADFIKPVLQEIGTMDFWKILMKPGRPLTFGRINESLFFGLPGNPVAVMVTFYLFVLPCLQKLSGRQNLNSLTFKASCQNQIRKRPGRREFQRGIASTGEDGRLRVALTGKQGSGILTSMSSANCFIVLTEERDLVEQGEEVDIQFFEQIG